MKIYDMMIKNRAGILNLYLQKEIEWEDVTHKHFSGTDIRVEVHKNIFNNNTIVTICDDIPIVNGNIYDMYVLDIENRKAYVYNYLDTETQPNIFETIK